MRAQPRHRTVQLAAVFATLLAVAVLTPRTAAAEIERGMKWQSSIPMTFTSGGTVNGENGTSFDINDDLGWGFSFGYNLNQHFLVGADFTWLSANYKATIATDINGDQIPDASADLSGTLDATNLQFFGQYNILKSRVTPFLRASLGWTWVDSNIPSGAPVGTCWWDPWYGYICGSWQPTFEDTEFAYGAAVGVRADVTDRFFLEGSYNVLWVDFNKADTPSFDGFRVNVGWSF